ncbi:Predicted transcriptional regulator [Streptobacillus moniliformis]|nr:Predicted transcriptional regulator [Streptobacillus moniliformis]
MNNRVKELRKKLKLSGDKFGSKLGVKRSTISNLENQTRNLTEQMIKSICREFNVNEEWLRYGNGPMFNSLKEISLDELAWT